MKEFQPANHSEENEPEKTKSEETKPVENIAEEMSAPSELAEEHTTPPRRKSSRLVLWLAVVATVMVTAAVVTAVVCSGSQAPQESPIVLSGTEFSLTNARFAYYFWSEYVYLCASENPPFDSGMSLAAQWYDSETTWQDKLTEMALETATQTMVLLQAAGQEHFTLPESYAETLETQKEAYRQQAVDSGYEGRTEEFLISLYGPYANEADFYAYLEDTFLATAYSDHLYRDMVFSDDEISSYYDEHADTYSTTYLIRKDDTRACDLRCIFLTGDDSEARADELQSRFEADPTEENFAALAAQYNEDESANEDGLYTNVLPNRAEESLRDWCFAAARQVGDEAVVTIESGHVLVYYAARSDTPLWKAMAESDLRYESYQNTYRSYESAANVTTFPDAVSLPVPDSLLPVEK